MTHSDRQFSGLPIRHALLLFLLAVLLMAPAFFTGLRGSDLLTQVVWIKLFSRQLWHGDWYPRWLEDMYAGAGSPVFFYYPPLTYYITALVAPPAAAGHEQLSIALSGLLAVYVSGITFYPWMREETGSGEAALVGSLLYMAAPLHVAHSFYFSMLFSSVWAYAWLPLVMRWGRRAATGGAREAALFALSMSLLLLTNLPETLIWGPIVVIYAALQLERETFLTQTVRFGAGLLLGFGLAAVYLLPATSYLHFAILKRQWTEASTDYHNFFLDFGWWGTLQGAYVVMWLVMLALIAVYWFTAKREVRKIEFFTVLSCIGLYMILPQSLAIWENITIMRILQFPLRFFVVPSLGLACLAGYAWPRFRFLAAVLVAGYLAVTIAAALWPREGEPDFDQAYALNIEQHANYLSSYDLVERYYTSGGLADVKAHMAQVEVVSGNATAVVREWEPRHIVLHVHAAERSVLHVRQFFFPGVKVTPGDSVIRYGREGKTGFILFDMAPGDADIVIELTPLAPEIWGRIISAVSVLLVLLLLNARRLKRRSIPAPETN